MSKGPIPPAELSLTAKQLETVSAINKANAAFWSADAEQFEQLRQKHPDAGAHRLMEAAREIVNAFTVETGITSYAAAVRAAEAIEALSRRTYAAGRQRANTRRKQVADQKVIEKFRAWEKRNSRSVAGLSAAQRVKVCCAEAVSSDREARRIRALLKQEKISTCTGVNGRDCG